MNQKGSVTLGDLDIKDIKNFPNWVKAGYNSRDEAIEGILKFLKDRQALFDGLGLTGVPVKRKHRERK